MAKPETRSNYPEVVRADLLLQGLLRRIEKTMHHPETKKIQPPPIELNPSRVCIMLSHLCSPERMTYKLRIAAVSYVSGRRIIYRESFGTLRSPNSSEFYHEVCVWDDTSGKITNFRRVQLSLLGQEIIPQGSLDNIEDSVNRLSQVVGENLNPLKNDAPLPAQ